MTREGDLVDAGMSAHPFAQLIAATEHTQQPGRQYPAAQLTELQGAQGVKGEGLTTIRHAEVALEARRGRLAPLTRCPH